MKGVRIVGDGPLSQGVKIYDSDGKEISNTVRRIRITMDPHSLIEVEMELLAERVDLSNLDVRTEHRCPYCGQTTDEDRPEVTTHTTPKAED